MVAPLDHLTRFGDPAAPALTVAGETIDYAAMERLVARLADWLVTRVPEEGARVATWEPKTWLTCLMPLAAARAGRVHVPINPALKEAQVGAILADSGATLVGSGVRRGSLEALGIDQAALEGEGLEPSDHSPDRLAALLYTSGSTGSPKGVMLSHANLMLGAEAVADYTGITPETRTLAVLPLAFDYGQNQLLATWRGGGHAVALDYLLANDVKKALVRHAITYLGALPPLWHQLMQLDWSGGEGRSVRTITNTGGAMTRALLSDLRDAFPDAEAHLMYGLTEAFRAASLDPALADAHPTSVGRAIPHAELMVVREDGSPCDPGEEGELVQAGPLVAQGYWNAPEKTAEKFRPAPAHSRYGGTAVWSGDRFVRDEEGLLHFRARADRMIKVSGNRISPDEILAVVEKFEGVREAAVTTRFDERLGAAIVLHAVGDGDEAAVRRAFRAAPPWFMPQEVRWHASLPRNPNGKIDMKALEAGE